MALFAKLLRAADVVIADAIAHAARAGVQRQPDFVVFVQADFGEMIAAAERAQGERPFLVEAAVTSGGGGFELLELGDARLAGVGEFGVVGAGGSRNAPHDACAETS